MVSDETLREWAKSFNNPNVRDVAQELLAARTIIHRQAKELVDAAELHLADETTIRQLERKLKE